MRGHSRSKNGVASFAYDPRIHAEVPQSRLTSKFVQVQAQHGLPGQARQ
jgi:hypothetical protein